MNAKFAGILSALCMGFAVSCATPLRVGPGIESERLLPSGALAYLKLDGQVSSLIMKALAGREGAAAAELMAGRTESAVLAAVKGEGGAGPAVYGIATGSYPAGLIAMKLSGDKSWKKEGPGWVQAEGTVRVGLASGGRLLLGTASLAPLAAAAARPNEHPIPALWAAAWDADLALYAPDPLSSIGAGFSLDSGAIPMQAMMLSARIADGRYETSMWFAFSDASSARVLSPICRLFVLAMARGVWAPRSSEILASARWLVEGATVSVSGLSLDAGELADFFGAAVLR